MDLAAEVDVRERIIIVGGVAGGASAAARARRVNEEADIVVYERGPYVSFANCGLPYYIAGEITEVSKLMVATPELFKTKYRVEVKIEHEVLNLDPVQRKIQVRGSDGVIFEDRYDKLILSQGANPLKPPFPGLDQNHVFTLRDIPDMLRIDSYIEEKEVKTAAVVGGGFIGLEVAEAFHRRGVEVHLVERAPHVMPMIDADMAEVFQNGIINHGGIHIHTVSSLESIQEKSITLEGGTSLPADVVLLSIGVAPEVGLAKEAGLKIGKTGGVQVNGRMESSYPDIYAVGDAAETVHRITGQRVRIPLAGPANRQGRVAGENAAGGHANYVGALGTSIVRVHDQQLAITGLGENQAEVSGLSFYRSTTKDLSHAGYYPGAKAVTSRLLVEEGTGRLLGAQVLGEDGVDKRIDVYATAIAAGMTVDQLDDLDLAYSPPFGSAIDAVNTAGRVASHVRSGELRTLQPDQVTSFDGQIVDVREVAEREKGYVENSIHIPLGELRDKLEVLDPELSVLVYCAKGLRGYLGTRILRQRGFRVFNLDGGYDRYQHSVS